MDLLQHVIDYFRRQMCVCLCVCACVRVCGGYWEMAGFELQEDQNYLTEQINTQQSVVVD